MKPSSRSGGTTTSFKALLILSRALDIGAAFILAQVRFDSHRELGGTTNVKCRIRSCSYLRNAFTSHPFFVNRIVTAPSSSVRR